MPRGCSRDPEATRAKQSAANRRRWEDPEYKARIAAKISAAILARHESDPVYRERIAAALEEAGLRLRTN